jgi:malonyl-CoA O-methyltransferase
MNIQDAYNEWSDSYDSDANLTRDLDSKLTRELLTDLQVDSILELGCGTGKNTSFLVQIGAKVEAVDFSQGMIQKAREKVKAGNVAFSSMDITQPWKFADESFDLITCSLVLEHIKDLSFVFAEASHCLKPKGQFFINELHPFRQYDGKKARFERGNETVEVDAFVHHISDFTNAASANDLKLTRLNEYWHEADDGKLPRIVSFMFGK